MQRQYVVFQVDALVFLELGDDVVDDALVKVFAAKEGVAVGGEHFKLVFAVQVSNFDDGNVEGAAAQIKDGNLRVARLFVHAKGQRRSGRLVDDALDFQTGNLARVLGGLTLAVVEVGGYGDDRFGDFFAQIVFGGFLHLAQHFGRNLRRGDFFVAHFYPGVAIVGTHDVERHQVDVFLHFAFFKTATNQAFDGKQGVFGVGHGLTARGGADQHFAFVGVGDHGRRGARAFGVFDDFRLAAFHDGDAAIGGAQVNTNDFRHVQGSFLQRVRCLEIRKMCQHAPACEGIWGEMRGFQEAACATITSAGRSTRS